MEEVVHFENLAFWILGILFLIFSGLHLWLVGLKSGWQLSLICFCLGVTFVSVAFREEKRK